MQKSGGRARLEWAAASQRNRWPRSPGIVKWPRPEYALERSVHQYRVYLGLVMLCLGGMVLLGASDVMKPYKLLKALEYQVVDESGKVLMKLGSEKVDEATCRYLQVFNSDGKPIVKLGKDNRGGYAVVASHSGSDKAEISINGVDAGHIQTFNADENVMVDITSYVTNAGAIITYGQNRQKTWRNP